MPKQQLVHSSEDRRAGRPAPIAAKPQADLGGPVIAAAKEQDGNTVLKLADRSTITLVGVARLDELTLFGGRLRAIRRVI